jgi:hypothetical protein
MALLVAATRPAGAEIYRYVDANGHEQFTTHLEDVPLAQREASAARAGGTLSIATGASPKPQPRASEPASQPELAAPSVPAAAAPGSAVPTAGGYDETWWRSTAQSHADRVERMQASVEACERNDARRRETSGLTPLDVCDAARAQLEHAEDALDQFEEQARRAEVPASWLR